MKKILNSQHSLLIVKELSNRMKDPLTVKKTVLAKNNKNPNPTYEHSNWDDLSLDGYPGVLLLFSQLDQLFPNEKWDAVAHNYVLEIKKSIEEHSIHSLSMFGGITGICFSIYEASRNKTRYEKLLNSLHTILLRFIEKSYFSPLKENLNSNKSSSPLLYDVIQGVSGIGNYFLKNPEEIFLPVLEEILNLLVKLTGTLEVEGKKVPGWHLTTELQLNEFDAKRYPKGNFNLGLAHGIPGVLSFLAKAYHQRIIVQGHREAIQRIVEWIKKWRMKEKEIYFWDATISFEDELLEKKPSHSHPARQGWCYGSPGITRSLYLAGVALNNKELVEYALESFHSVFEMNQQDWQLPGPTFCHGTSGLLMITHLMACDTNSKFLFDRVKRLEGLLLDFYKEDTPFGFKDRAPTKDKGFAEINRAGLLEGASGVLLSLLSLNFPQSLSWQTPFLIDI